MDDLWDINRTTSTTKNGTDVMYYTVANIVAMGGTIESYGTGTTGAYSATGAGWNYAAFSTLTRAWVRVRMPSPSTSEWCFQTLSAAETTASSWARARIKRSPIAFSGGSPSASVMPSSTKERVTCGPAGTDASPTLTNAADLVPSNAATAIRMHTGILDAFGNSNPWYTFGHYLGTTTLVTLLYNDHMITGSFDALDADPYAQYTAAGTGGVQYFYTGYGTGSEASASMTQPTSQLCYAAALAVDANSGKDTPGRMLYYSSTQAKGYGRGVSLKGQARAYPNTINLNTDAKVYLGAASAGLLVKWPNGQTPQL